LERGSPTHVAYSNSVELSNKAFTTLFIKHIPVIHRFKKKFQKSSLKTPGFWRKNMKINRMTVIASNSRKNCDTSALLRTPYQKQYVWFNGPYRKRAIPAP
jgi:hypothetical protein